MHGFGRGALRVKRQGGLRVLRVDPESRLEFRGRTLRLSCAPPGNREVEVGIGTKR